MNETPTSARSGGRAAADGRAATIGVLCGMGASIAFSLNDVAIKWLSGDYPLHQITFLRGVVALVLILAVVVPLDGSYRALASPRWRFHLLRGAIVVFANMTFYMGLAAVPLGEATAIYFVAPLVITVLSVLVLGETVGPRRWTAVILGFAGVIIIIRPGFSGFQAAMLLPLVAACAYGSLQITTRHLGLAERASTMSFWLQFTFVGFSGAVGLAFGDGRHAGGGDPSIEFLLRAWVWPTPGDWAIIIGLGVLVTASSYMVSQAYRLAEAGLVAPFEYVALPVAIFWSIVIWGDWPDALSWLGIALIALSGVYVFLREATLGHNPFSRKRLPPPR